MALSSSQTVAAAPQAVFEALTSRECAEGVAARVGGSLQDHQVTDDGDARTTVTTYALPADRLPDMVAKVLGKGLIIALTEAWGAPAADGSRTSTLAADVKSAPVKVSGTETLAPQGEGSLLSMSGEVKSSIPFLGGKISQAAEPFVDRLLAVRCQIVESQLS